MTDERNTIADFLDPGADDDEPVKGITQGDIRRWHDELDYLVEKDLQQHGLILSNMRVADAEIEWRDAEIKKLRAEVEELVFELRNATERSW